MTTRREQIIAHIVAGLNAAPIGAPVYRSRVVPLQRGESPALVVEPLSDTPAQNIVPKLDWALTVMVTFIMRGSALEVAADPLLQAAHASIMADLSQGGLAIDTQPGPVRWRFADADAGACDVECEYNIQYRTAQQDLTIS